MKNKKSVTTNAHKSVNKSRRGPKKGASYIPPAQQEKMKQMFLTGEFISAIARKTGRDWKTVAKIVRSADMTRYMDQCREKAMEVIPDAIEMVHKEMQRAPNKDRVKAGIDFLTRARVFDEIRAPVQPVRMSAMDTEGADRRAVKEIIAGFAEMAVETHKSFGMPMPELALVKAKLANGCDTDT